MQWYLIPALNGIGLSIPATQEESAQHLLHCVDTGEASLANEGYEQPRAYGRLGAWLYLLIPMGLITLPLMLLLLPFVIVQLISGAILPENPDEFAELALVLAEFIFALFLAWALISFYLNTRRFLKKRNQEQSSQ
ncbi:hypothetical protein [Henriciella sp.]|uniref:hypothetical protein n=1 Tax=Henriciella sp. TaxID=1968823 RepID=UPI00262DE828|nr:hypothetical protein [Henriciella sp.]